MIAVDYVTNVTTLKNNQYIIKQSHPTDEHFHTIYQLKLYKNNGC